MSFYEKQRLVFSECSEAKNNLQTTHQKQSFSKCENTYNHSLSRVRVRTHHRSFCLFAVTSVTANIVKHYISDYYASPEHILTNTFYNPPQYHQKHLEKPQVLAYFFSVSKPYILPSVTLVTAKNLHRCWKAHAYARMRDGLSSRDTNLTSKLSKTKLEKNILSLFLRFFSDWVYFPPI